MALRDGEGWNGTRRLETGLSLDQLTRFISLAPFRSFASARDAVAAVWRPRDVLGECYQ